MSAEPTIEVVRGNPTDEELAAVLAVLLPAPAQGSDRERPASGWSRYWRGIGAPLVAGPGAWRRSGQPE